MDPNQSSKDRNYLIKLTAFESVSPGHSEANNSSELILVTNRSHFLNGGDQTENYTGAPEVFNRELEDLELEIVLLSFVVALSFVLKYALLLLACRDLCVDYLDQVQALAAEGSSEGLVNHDMMV